MALPPNVSPTCDMEKAVAAKDLVIIVVPSHVMRRVAGGLKGKIGEKTVLVSASKGIENKTHLTMSRVIAQVLPELSKRRLVVLSGPSFAKEVARKVPTVVTAASADLSCARFVQHVFATEYFRVYAHEDVLGVELGGAVKNVIAIASGIIDGMGLGLNTRAALITRGQTEIRRLGLKMGANPRTFTGSAGMGDLILTCTGALSRNYTVGEKIGRGMTPDEILKDMRQVAEGVKNARSVHNLAKKLGVEMPITNEIHGILYQGADPAQALRRLMTRELKQELDED